MYVFIPLFKPSVVPTPKSINYDLCLLMSSSIGLETV